MKGQKPGAGQVQGHRRPGHVGNGQVGHRGHAAGHDAFSEFAKGIERHFCRATHQPGCQQGRVVGGQQALEALHRGFDFGGGRHDGVHALERMRQVRAQLHQAQAHLVAQVAGVGGTVFAQRHRHGRHQRFFGQAVVLREVVAQGGRANPQHDVVEGAAHRLAHGLAVGQRQGGGDKHAARGDAGIERRLRREFHRHCGPHTGG